ncbi:MAG: uroporphyrinogen decarboxylase family protein [Clostridia bacterium]
MNTRERMKRIFEHREADRVPVSDYPWPTTLKRWKREGMPDVGFEEYFDLDMIVDIGVDNSPRFPAEVLEETEAYKLYTTSFGATLKQFRNITSTPEFVDFWIKTPEDWEKAKKDIFPSADRINWARLEKNYGQWRERGCWIQAGGWFGFDVTHSWIVGTERVLMALVTDPEWVMDMFGTFLDVNLRLLDMVWDKGYTFDSFRWCDDMGYKNNQFFSVAMYRELLKPFHQRAIDWAHGKGIKAHLHSCGDVNPFVPELVDMGLDCLNPLEVKAGMDPLALKARYGDALVLHGGIDAVNWSDTDRIIAEIEEKLPVLKENGGYIFASDHSIPDEVSFRNICAIMEKVKKAGAY